MGKLRVFHAKLAEEGEPRGLIGPRDVGIIWERRILNSAAIVPFVKEATAKKQFKTVADIGSGGGFPGIVAAACLPDHRFTLVEPMERRVEWLNECVADMELNNVTVVRARANEMIEAIAGATGAQGGNRGNGSARNGKGGKNGRGVAVRGPVLDLDGKPIQAKHPFAVVTCRAVAPMTKLSGWTLPLLERGGRFGRTEGAVRARGDRKGFQRDRQMRWHSSAGGGCRGWSGLGIDPCAHGG